MISKVYPTVTCPYCGLEQAASVELEYVTGNNYAMKFCDYENGGCEKPFMVSVTLTTQTKVYAMSEGVQQ